MDIATALKQLIEEKGVTPYEISIKTGISQASLSRILNGKTNKPNIHNSEILAKYLNISSDWLNTDNNNSPGVPYYDIDITATLTESFSDITEEPEFYVDFKPFNDCSAYLPVFGDSMHPLINSGEIVALKKVEYPEYIQYGEPHLVITNAVTNNMRTLKIVRKHKDESMIILKPINPDFDELAIPRNSILSIYIVKGKITRKQL